MPAISFSNGLASGLDTQAIIDALISSGRRPAILLQAQIAQRTSKITALQGLSAILLSLKMEADSLRSGTTFDALSVTSSDEEALSATAEAGAAAGSYSFTVDALAQPEILASQGYASLDAAVGTGTLSIAVGSAGAKSITVGSADATLAGLRDAINESGADVTASIVNTGSGAEPYRLVLTSKKSGAANTITIDASLSGGSTPLFVAAISTVTKGAAFAGTATFGNVGPAVTGTFAGTATPSSGGAYTGAAARTFTFDAVNAGTIGTDQIAFTWSDGAGASGTIVVPSSYTPGTEIAVRDGLTVSFAAGTVSAGDDFTIAATGRGTYTGTKAKTFTFEVTTGGTIGADAITIAWDDGQGATGTIDVPAAYAARTPIAVAEGVVLALDGGTLIAGDTFTIAATSPVLQKAQDASITFGSAAGGGNPIVVTSETNEFADVLDGLTITAKAVSDAPVTLEVARDIESIKTNVKDLVERYNSVIDFMKTQLSYDSEAKRSGPLFGDPTLLSIDFSLRRMATASVVGLDGAFKALSSIGVTSTATGQLTVNDAKLTDALEDDLDSVRALFASLGSTSDPDIQYLALGDATRATSTHRDAEIGANGYEVRITRAAETARIAGAQIADPAVTPFTIDSSNNVVQVKVDGRLSSQVALAQGSYASGAALALEVQTKLNADSALASSPVVVSWVDDGAGQGHFEVASESYGSASSIELIAAPGSAFTGGLGFAAAQVGLTMKGTDVAGTINGEEAHGRGQMLIGGPENPEDPKAFDTLGVRLLVTLTPEQLAQQGAEQGTLEIVEGVGAILSRELQRLTDSTVGTLHTREEAINRQIEAFNDQIDRIEERLAIRRRSLEEQFGRLENALIELQSQSSFLGSQLANLGRERNSQG